MKRLKTLASILFVIMILLIIMAPTFAFAANGEQASSSEDGVPLKTIATGIAIGLAAGGGGIGMGIATGRTTEAISRQPEVESKVRSTFMLGLVFIETAIIYALLVVILIIFVM